MSGAPNSSTSRRRKCFSDCMSDDRAHPSTPPRPEPQLSLVVVNQRSELARMSACVDQFGEECGLSAEDITNVNLALDELVSNVIKYGFQDSGEHQIHVTVRLEGDLLTISIVDDGQAFNPLEAPAPDL